MAIQSDFMSAINQIAAERNIEQDEVLEAIEQAMLTAYKKDFGGGESLNVEIDRMTGAVRVYSDKKVVDEVTDEGTQIDLKEAQMIEPKLKEGDHVEIDVTPDASFGRIAAQAARQVIMQKIREAEKESVIKEFKDKLGTIETAIVQRMEGSTAILEIRKAAALMPPEEQIDREFYRSGQMLKVLVKTIQKGPRGKNLIVSRSDNDFLKQLFILEVPELLSGSIDIKSIAREAGSRSKVAVWANVDGVDPIGSCVGQKGTRILNIMNELKNDRGEEKIDIILWDEDPAVYIQNALSPAKVETVQLNKVENEALVLVPDDQLSLAIGKEGQNVRLAAKLTGWKIDIRGEGEAKEALEEFKAKLKEDKTDTTKKTKTTKKTTKKGESAFEDLKLSSRIENALIKAGITNIDELQKAVDNGDKIAGIGDKSMEEIKNALK